MYIYICALGRNCRNCQSRRITRNFLGRRTIRLCYPCKIFTYSDAYLAFDAYCLSFINIYKTRVARAKRMKIFNENFVKYQLVKKQENIHPTRTAFSLLFCLFTRTPYSSSSVGKKIKINKFLKCIRLRDCNVHLYLLQISAMYNDRNAEMLHINIRLYLSILLYLLFQKPK